MLLIGRVTNLVDSFVIGAAKDQCTQTRTPVRKLLPYLLLPLQTSG